MTELPLGLRAAAALLLGCLAMPMVLAALEVASVAVVAVVVAVALRARRERDAMQSFLHRSSPSTIDGTVVRTGRLAGECFVAGLARPTIFCDREVLGRLRPAEVRAVVLHERAHQRRHDPLRAALTAQVAQLLPRRWRASLLVEAEARREILADQYALANGASRSSIASALLTLGGTGASRLQVGFGDALDRRVAALSGHAPVPSRPVLASALAGITLGALGCLSTVHQLHGLHAAFCC